MCCAINAYSLAVFGVVVPLYAAFYAEEHGRRAFLRVWRRRHSAAAGDDSSRDSASTRTTSTSSSSQTLSASSSDTDAPAAGDTPSPPLVLGRRRHHHLRRRLSALRRDPTDAAEREQDAVEELLQRRAPRAAWRVLLEVALVCMVAWPTMGLVVEAAGPWLCAA